MVKFDELVAVFRSLGVPNPEREALGFFLGSAERTDFDLVITLLLPNVVLQSIPIPAFLLTPYLKALNTLLPDLQPAFQSLADLCVTDIDRRPAGTGLFYSPSKNIYVRIQAEGVQFHRATFFFDPNTFNFPTFQQDWLTLTHQHLSGIVLTYDLLSFSKESNLIPLDTLPNLDDIEPNYPPKIQLQIKRIKHGLCRVFHDNADKFITLLVGKSGVGKTFLAGALLRWAAEKLKATGVKVSPAQFIDASDIIPRFVPRPLVLVEDMEALAATRKEGFVTGATLHLLDKFGGVASPRWGAILTTNLPQLIDKAMLRPARIDELVVMDTLNGGLAWQAILYWLRKHGIDWQDEPPSPTILDGLTFAECAAIAERIYHLSALGVTPKVPDIVADIKQWRRVSKWDFDQQPWTVET